VKPHVLVCRLDSAGDVLLSGPAVRAVADRAKRVTMLCGPRGQRAAELLPGVDEVLVHAAPWIDPDPEPVDRDTELRLVGEIESLGVDQAIVLTSFHQSPLPTALLLRFAGVASIAATSVDYPGSLLDVRHTIDEYVHEVDRSLSLVGELGYELPLGDDGALRVTTAPGDSLVRERLGNEPYVVVHPGASVSARAWDPERCAELVQALGERGWRAVVTGSPEDAGLTAFVADSTGVDLGGQTTLGELAEVIRGADAIVVGNTGPAHLAAAVGTPVVSIYAPTVPAVRWRPWQVPHELLHVAVPCAGCRARDCPVPGHPCIGEIGAVHVLAALARLAPSREEALAL
jgi:ADP-heptose:LPS heptosyltransferase